jgi:hypothetical protein
MNVASPLANLQRLMQPRPPREAVECCEFCRVELRSEHRHVVDRERRALKCACTACYLLFTTPGAAGGKYRAASDRVVELPADGDLPDLWLTLQIPVGVAFFFHDSAARRVVAFYPSPAGATESSVPLDSWSTLTRELPVLTTLEPDVEAVLVSTRPPAPAAFIVPIDVCYELVGRIRKNWRGLDGGEDSWREVDGCLTRLRSQAVHMTAVVNTP